MAFSGQPKCLAVWVSSARITSGCGGQLGGEDFFELHSNGQSQNIKAVYRDLKSDGAVNVIAKHSDICYIALPAILEYKNARRWSQRDLISTLTF